jgi:hypothetical protein
MARLHGHGFYGVEVEVGADGHASAPFLHGRRRYVAGGRHDEEDGRDS